MIPGPTTHASGDENFLCEALSAIHEEIRDSGTGSAHPASLRRFRICTANPGAKTPRPRRGRAVNNGQRSQRFSFGGFDLFFGRAVD